MLNSIFEFIINHWQAISTAILFIISTFYGTKKLKLSAKDSAKDIAQKLMFGIEKRADEFLTSPVGIEKFKLVVEQGYSLFPSNVRFFVSKNDFEKIVQDLHDEAIKFLEAEIAKQPVAPAPVPPVVNPIPVAPITQ
jgi:hypothetical protein